MEDDQWKELSIPMGLVNQIKKNLDMQPNQDKEMQIDSSSKIEPMAKKPSM